MAYYTDKQRKYWAKWPSKRANKWKFVLTNGVLGFGIPVFFAVYLFKIKLDFSKFELKEFLIGLGVWIIGGFIWGLWMFNLTEKKYQIFLKTDEGE